MSANSLLVIAGIAIFISIVCLGVCFALLEKINEVSKMAYDNRASIGRHTKRNMELTENIGRIDHTINDIYDRIGELSSIIRQYFHEVERHEDSE